jgi:hypothetical protein
MTQSFMEQPRYQDIDYIDDYEDNERYQSADGYIEQYQDHGSTPYRDQRTFYPSQSNSLAALQPHAGQTQLIPLNRTQNNNSRQFNQEWYRKLACTQFFWSRPAFPTATCIHQQADPAYLESSFESKLSEPPRRRFSSAE